ncbi:MAG: type II toxin-antitoxin system prevent-host-death family antitoxin [Pseudomonadota bacterium]
MQAITANDLKVKGVPLLDDAVSEYGEAIITVRGQARYVVLTIDAYDRLRELELDAALAEAKRDLEAGRVHRESVADHIKRITA